MSERIKMFGIDFDNVSMEQAVAKVINWVRESDYKCHYVVTPNVDHVVKIQKDSDFLATYSDASLIVVDGKPVLLASRLLGKPLPETVPGSDLCPSIFTASKSAGGISVFLLGAAEGVAERATTTIKKQWPWVDVCGVYSPTMGFSAESHENKKILQMINDAAPDILIIGLGAPKQEKWVYAMKHQLKVKVSLCAGATIDFLAGEKKRAPVWMRKVGLEWLHRAISEPKRLLGRYLHDAWVFPWLFIREWFGK